MDFPLPPVGEGLFEVELLRWLVRPGDPVARGQGLMEVMSDKATMEVPSPFAGTVASLAAAAGTKIRVGHVVLSYTPAGGPVLAGASPPPADAHLPPQPPPGRFPPAAPSVRLLARKLGVDLAGVRGTGPNGRILLDDLTPLLKPVPAGEQPASAAAKPAGGPKLDLGVAGTRIKLVGLRRATADRMVAAKRHIPHYSYIDECDFTDLVRLRDQLREPFAKAGVKLTYLAFVVTAVARALKEVPVVNASLDEAAGEIVMHARYHVGVATATPGGLVVPVVRDAGAKDLAAVAAEIERVSGDARAGRPRRDDLAGGTFTVTSVGNIGGLISTPIINHPEVGILGVGRVVRRPVYDDRGAVRPADMVYLSFSFDHRVVDGAVGAAFGNAVVRHLRNPGSLLLPETFGG